MNQEKFRLKIQQLEAQSEYDSDSKILLAHCKQALKALEEAQLNFDRSTFILKAVEASRKMLERGYDIGGNKRIEYRQLTEAGSVEIQEFTAYLNGVGRKKKEDNTTV